MLKIAFSKKKIAKNSRLSSESTLNMVSDAC